MDNACMALKPLTAAELAFLTPVARAVVANPFGAERAELDRELDPGGPPAGRLQRIVAGVSRRLSELDRSGRGALARVPPEQREVLVYAELFDLYHAWSAAIDEHVAAQEAAGDEPCPAPFAAACLADLARRGFERDEAKKHLGLFFQLRRAYTFIDRALVGRSACMQGLREALWNDIFTRDIRVYEAWLWERMEDFSTLLLGETGTGKGSAAAAIGKSGFIPFDEKRGRFADSFARAFVPVNLAEFPESLLEAELFGHEKGAFTGALERREGVFARCSPHGSIFLDEVGELGTPVQIKLLRVLQERLFTPVGGRRARRFHGRVIAATNRALDELGGGLLRPDFFYRLCTDVIVVPPLRQRLSEAPEELALLVERILERTLGSGELSASVCAAIERELGRGYAWPGNVRELEQCVRRILLKGRYEGARAPAARDALAGDPFLSDVRAGALDADTLLAGYCARLFAELGGYEAVARRTRLDRRTVKRYVELAGPSQGAPSMRK